ncbi:uncharacterized protein NPIL_455181 [Nephila pilipes]|uniref:Uncharacterized protein n=1 Tax=Nephila pilipes TaxID=299642 RepID=A0A8X6UGN2_NEPPI|nr:uncharacterized protein NPIL_455181 [Nephila pilipes]
MLLCVAGGSSAEFRRDRPQAGSRCSSQSFLIKNNANQQVMVEERCSMTSSTVSADHVAARATLSLHLRSNKAPAKSHICSKESSVAYRSRVIVVSGEDEAFSSYSEKGETCSTTTTFKSNVVNGKRGTNTILVRYKPSKPVSVDSDDELRFEFCSKNDGVSSSAVSSSPPSTISSENSSVKEKSSISAWAQIMELEGYRSPAIGLDNGPSKHVSSGIESDSLSNFSSLSCESYRSELSSVDPSLGNSCGLKHLEGSYCSDNQINNLGEEGRFRKHNIVSIASKCNSGSLSSSRLTDSSQINADVSHSSNNRSLKDFALNEDVCNQMQTVSLKPMGPVQNRYSDTLSNSTSYRAELGSTSNHDNLSSKFKSPMFRSESSRVSKVAPIERNKNRRKTLPDGNLTLNPSINHNSIVKSQKSPEHDPNASWGRYNSRAMRDSVRKVAEKYAETVYMRRLSRSQLDSLPEARGVQLTRYVAPLNETDHMHVSKQTLHLQNHLYHPKRASSTSHLHEIPCEKDLESRSRLHIIMPASIRHDHSNMTSDYKRNFVPYESKESKLCQKLDDENDVIFNENDKDSICSSDDPKSIQMSDAHLERIPNSCFNKNENRMNYIVPDDDISTEGKIRGVFSHPKRYQAAHSAKNNPKNFSSIECKVSSSEAKHPTYLSFHMQDIKSKLCSDCAQSAELGPPSKQSACRAKHELSDTCSPNGIPMSKVSLLKRAPLVIDEGDSSPSLYLRPLPSKTVIDSKLENGPRKCTMLTAREMAELVHGKGNADSKQSQAGVTNKVSSWIQKQKDKRKPMFFIGDTPSFFIENPNENNSEASSKTTNRKSRRSLSLSSVREGEVSKNCNGSADSSSEVKSSSNGEEVLLKSNEHKGLFIKRTSSSCSNRGSTRRKDRQGSLVREEREFIKGSNCHLNQVDGCVASWNNQNLYNTKNCSHKSLLSNNESDKKETAEFLNFQPRGKFPEPEVTTPQLGESSIFRKNVNSSSSNKPLKAQSEKYAPNSEISNLQIENSELICDDNLNSSLLGSQGSRHSYSVVTSRNADLSDLTRPERSFVSKKLLNFKQITRALSLHSLKKKTKELPMCSNTTTHLEAPPAISLSKWTRGSKRKIENMKYGSLRKSLSYCELTARGAKVSGKLDYPVNLLPSKKISAHKPSFTPSKLSNCACASFLRRSVSLYWQFPLHKHQDYTIENTKNDILAKLCFSRLYRRNTMMPFLREMKNKRHNVPDAPESFSCQHESRISRLDYKQSVTQHSHLFFEQSSIEYSCKYRFRFSYGVGIDGGRCFLRKQSGMFYQAALPVSHISQSMHISILCNDSFPLFVTHTTLRTSLVVRPGNSGQSGAGGVFGILACHLHVFDAEYVSSSWKHVS